MVANPNFNYLTPEEYLKVEETSLIKHEYRNGYAYPIAGTQDLQEQPSAIAGATDSHVTISVNLVSVLKSHLRGSGCRPYVVDMKAHIEAKNTYYYPDVMVTCDERGSFGVALCANRAFSLFKRYPCLIIEVLSDSTEAFDRGEKFEDYRTIDTLQEYVLVSQTRKRVECFRRNAEGLWVLYSFAAEDTLHLTSINFSCAVADIYEDVEFATAPPPVANN
jgi:Uma2 family endonuclease